jgi:hypothetical protein
VDRFRAAWQTAVDREQLARKNLEALTSEGMKINEAATQAATMREEAEASHELYVRVQEKAQEAGFAAGIQASNIYVVDPARQPVKPVAPNLPLYMAITLFVGLWLAVGVTLMLESIRPRTMIALLAALLAGAAAQAQTPTPNTSGLPGGVLRLPNSPDARKLPDPRTLPPSGITPAQSPARAACSSASAQLASPMPAPIAPGDFLDVSEVHTPEFHSTVRVTPAGTVTLPLAGEVHLNGLDEQAAARAIEAALVARGMLLHPQVTVLVTSYIGQDVSVLGEVAHPGVYPFTLHHRLLDLISAASGCLPMPVAW